MNAKGINVDWNKTSQTLPKLGVRVLVFGLGGRYDVMHLYQSIPGENKGLRWYNGISWKLNDIKYWAYIDPPIN
jgi:hypothetical protein